MSEVLLKSLGPLLARVRRDHHAVKGEGGVLCMKEPLADEKLLAHLDGSGPPRGAYLILPGESTTRVAVLDFDSHKGETPWPDMLATAQRVLEAMRERGLKPRAFRSTGGSGVHLFCLWQDPQDAYSVRALLAEVLVSVGLKAGTGSVARGEVEVFPKQDRVDPGKWGNMVILPLAGKSEPLDDLTGDLEPMGRGYMLSTKWEASDPVPLVERPERTVVPATGDMAVLQEQLAYLDTDGMGRDTWRDVVFGIGYESGGSEEGFQLADDFSARFDSYDYDGLRAMWDAADHAKAGGVTGRTICMLAGEGGWQEPQLPAEAFEVLPALVPPPRLRPNFEVDGKGRIEPSVDNIYLALTRADLIGFHICYDAFQDEVVAAPFGSVRGQEQWQVVPAEQTFHLRRRLEKDLGFKRVVKKDVEDGLKAVARDNAIDTAMRWLEGLDWDGTPRIAGYLQDYFGVEPSPYATAVSLYWWTAMAGRVFRPGCQADMVPILVSTVQGYRKSSTIAAMVPEGMHRQISFDQSEDNRARLLKGVLAAELAELKGLRTRDAEEIKAWVTRRFEEYVPKYQEKSVRIGRRTIFVGTSNSTELFDDPTGERRWLPIEVGVVDVDAIARDHKQLWAEAAVVWRASGVAWKEAEELARLEHGAFKVTDTWEEALRIWADADSILGGSPSSAGFTTREALVEGLGFTDKAIKRAEEMRVAKVLQHAGFYRKVEKRDGKAAGIWRPVTSCYDLA